MISELTARSVFRAMTLCALAGAWLGCEDAALFLVTSVQFHAATLPTAE